MHLCTVVKYWLIKSEPFKYPWDQLKKDKQTFWDGVRNYQARNNMKLMEKGDPLFFYHSNQGKEIVGIAEVCRTHYQDPTIDDERWVAIDVKPVKDLKNPVTLASIKTNPNLEGIGLVRQMRLSVVELTKIEFDEIIKMSETNG